MQISENMYYIGVNDRKIDLFEGQYPVPNGVAYNSYLIKDKKTVVFDTVDGAFEQEWLDNLEKALNGTTPDYLIVQHMEPDHSAGICAFAKKYPTAKILSTDKAFVMMKQYFGDDFADRRYVIKDGDKVSIGERTLTFIAAPMVHWPEVIFTYVDKDKTLFSADAFGKFGALDAEEDWACEARRYYVGIVAKYGFQVQNALKKLSGFAIERICPLHGPILSENLGYYLSLYNVWSSYGVESEGVVIAYTSVYGNTKKAVEALAQKLTEKGCEKVVLHDLARCDTSEAAEDAFRYGKLVLATTTYNGGIFPFMRTFIHELTDHNFQNRKIGFIENGTWAPVAARQMKTLLENAKNLTFAENTVTLRSALNEENAAQIDRLAEELING